MKLAHANLDRYKPEDLKKIENALNSYGILVPCSDIALAWEEYSTSIDSMWAIIPENDEEIYKNIIAYLILEDW